jgi:hypothetical protein
MYLTDLVANQQTTIRNLRDLLLPRASEKTEAVLKREGIEGISNATAGKRDISQPGRDHSQADKKLVPLEVSRTVVRNRFKFLEHFTCTALTKSSTKLSSCPGISHHPDPYDLININWRAQG